MISPCGIECAQTEQSLDVFSFEGVMVVDESQNASGSFKIRGVQHQLRHLGAVDHLVTFTSGSHGLAVAHSAAGGLRVTVVMPVWSDARKQRALRDLGCRVIIRGATASECESIAHDLARSDGAGLVHPYRSPYQISGYVDLWRMIAARFPLGADVFVPVGSGALLAAGVLAQNEGARLHLVGVEAERARKLALNLAAGREVQVVAESLVASALNVDVIPDNVRTVLERSVGLTITWASDEEIAAAGAYLLSRNVVTDPAAAAGFAAAFCRNVPLCHAQQVVVLTGRGCGEIRESVKGA